ncbi:MAG: hypothetical protein ACFFBY_01615 [Promethearchaeota archaeon]
MTIIFGYFQYLNLFIFLYTVVPAIISANFAIIISIFLFRVHRSRKETIQSSNLLKVAGILIIIFKLLPFALPGVQAYSETAFETLILISYILIFELMSSVPFFIAYGVFFYVFGKRNKEEINVYSMIAGILWMSYYGFVMIVESILAVISLLYGFPIIQNNIYNFVRFSFIIVNLNAFILLIIDGAKNKHKNLLVVGILGLTAFATNFIYSILLNYLFILYP